MIDLSNLKAPGWSRVVADLTTPAPDDRSYLAKMLAILVQVSGARQGVLYAPVASRDEGGSGGAGASGGGGGGGLNGAAGGLDGAGVEVRPMMIWPPTDPSHVGEGGPPGEVRVAFGKVSPAEINSGTEAVAAARTAAGTRTTQVFGLEGPDQLYDAGGRGYIVALPIGTGGAAGGAGGGGSGGGSAPGEPAPVRAVVSLLLEARSRQALQTTLALLEVLAGYAATHHLQQSMRRLRTAAASLDMAARLIAAVNQNATFKGAALQLVNDLSRQLGAERVSLGWVRNAGKPGEAQGCRVAAISDTEHVDRRMAGVQKLEHAMDECLDQEQAVMHPPPPAEGEGADAVLSQAVTHAHRELVAQDAGALCASIPLRLEEGVTGVLLIEARREAGKLEVAQLELLQAALDLVSPVLAIRRSDDRAIATRTWDWVVKTGAWAVGPKHTVWKLAAVAAFVLAVVVTFVQAPYRVGAPAELLARTQFAVSAPFPGVLAVVEEGAKAGERVEAGQLLARMDTTELTLSLLDAQQEVVLASKQADDALSRRDLGEHAQAQARADQARARVDLFQQRVSRAEIRAPIAGTIISGSLSDQIGATMELGQELFRIADLDDMVVVARVADSDIGFMRAGGTGHVATRADPATKLPVVIEQVVPLAQPVEGKNAFEVRARIDAAAVGDSAAAAYVRTLRPGMEGRARFDADRRSLLSIGTRRIEDAMRLWLWW